MWVICRRGLHEPAHTHWRMQPNMTTAIDSASQVRWDLSPLYANIEDPRLEEDPHTLTGMAKEFSARYRGKLAERLGAAVRDYAEIDMLSGKITSYLFLRESTD